MLIKTINLLKQFGTYMAFYCFIRCLLSDRIFVRKAKVLADFRYNVYEWVNCVVWISFCDLCKEAVPN